MISLADINVQEYLLGRRAQHLLTRLDRDAFAGQRVLVTGAGGSVGSELARQVAACAPSRLTLFEQSEYNLFRIEQALREEYPEVPLDPVLGDVRRARSVRAACQAARPHVVYHAAAYKHVTMTERAVCQAVEANVLGSVVVTRAAAAIDARMVLISSDKAAAPTSVMGATKRLAELAVLSHASTRFRPVAVRFGNILGSSGSVVEVLIDRIQRGLPLPITDPAATRFFMTAREAVSLVMKADLIGQSGEIYWLDMGVPVRLSDLVKRLLALAKREGLPPVPVQVVGLRPGEKLREELTTQALELQPTEHERVWTARQPAFDVAAVRRLLRALGHDVRANDAMATLNGLCTAVPDFAPSDQAWRHAAAATISSADDSQAQRPILAPQQPTRLAPPR